MAWSLPTDPVTLAVVLFVLAFSVVNWLRWRSKEAWLDRVMLEQSVEESAPDRREAPDPDDEDI